MSELELKWGEFLSQCPEQLKDEVAPLKPSGSFQQISSGNCGIGLLSGIHGSYEFMYSAAHAKSAKYKSLLDGWGGINSVVTQDKENWLKARRSDLSVIDPICHLILKQIEMRPDRYNLYILSDSVNKGEAGRPEVGRHFVSTAVFGKWLYARRIGYIIQSPIAVNHVHCNEHDLSLVQVWVWAPPWGRAWRPKGLFGRGKLLTIEENCDLLLTSKLKGLKKDEVTKKLSSVIELS